jgi:carbon storage regulator
VGANSRTIIHSIDEDRRRSSFSANPRKITCKFDTREKIGISFALQSRRSVASFITRFGKEVQMLVLSRKEGSHLVIGDDIIVKVTKIRGNRVSIAIDAPPEVSIRRGEILKVEVASKTTKGNQRSATSDPSVPNVAAYHA